MRDSYRGRIPSAPMLLIGAALLVPVVAVLLHFLGLVRILSGGFPVKLSTFADIAGVFGSILLTLALVLLYSEQTKIQERQEEWMEAEHVPDVFVHGWEVTQNRVELKLSNLGTGVARNLRTTIEIETRDRFGVSSAEFSAQVLRESSSARVLRPDEDSAASMTGYFELSNKKGSVESEDMTIESVLLWLNSENSSMTITVRIKYDYIRRRSGVQRIFSCEVDPTNTSTVEELLLSVSRQYDDELETPPENIG